MTIQILPDGETTVVELLRADPDIAALAGTRGYNATLPARVTFPCWRVTRYGGAPAVAYPLVLDRVTLQVDTWAATKAEARELVETIRAVMAARAPGKHGDAVITRVELGPLSYSPDEVYDPPKPRYIADVTVYVKPAA